MRAFTGAACAFQNSFTAAGVSAATLSCVPAEGRPSAESPCSSLRQALAAIVPIWSPRASMPITRSFCKRVKSLGSKRGASTTCASSAVASARCRSGTLSFSVSSSSPALAFAPMLELGAELERVRRGALRQQLGASEAMPASARSRRRGRPEQCQGASGT
jgi:hypothetical protein